jgi:hypothetical protein
MGLEAGEGLHAAEATTVESAPEGRAVGEGRGRVERPGDPRTSANSIAGVAGTSSISGTAAGLPGPGSRERGPIGPKSGPDRG